MTAASTALLVAAGVVQKYSERYQRDQVPLRIHVNGTRGKSTVTRLIADMLNYVGIRTFAKVTGEAPTILHPELGDKPVFRIGPARVQEQAKFLSWAAKEKAEAAVLECMALVAEYQLISEKLIGAHIGVITNARLDHLEVMGPDRAAVARSLCQMIPFGGTVILGDHALVAEAEKVAKARSSNVVLAKIATGMTGKEVAIAITATLLDQLDWPPETRERAEEFLRLSSTESDAPLTMLSIKGLTAVPLWTANDVDTFEQILQGIRGETWLVFNHRSDRPLRTHSFIELFRTRQERIAGILLIGNRGSLASFRRHLPSRILIRQLGVAHTWSDLAVAAIAAGAQQGAFLVGCGNWKGAPTIDD